MTDARATLQSDEEGIRVTRYDMDPGCRIPWHRHEHPYLVVPLSDGVFDVVTSEQVTPQRTTTGATYRREAGAEHELVNGSTPYSFIEIEFTQ
ncbi:cupin [Frigoribacterium sp. UYMn621]|jgi:quercetin dioxygenase-like cupin family protein|uniref:cupin n=1 Tax=Frigoribacterium sp. UYMn621 TaxID=3156343 RepID=UPI0033913DB2